MHLHRTNTTILVYDSTNLTQTSDYNFHVPFLTLTTEFKPPVSSFTDDVLMSLTTDTQTTQVKIRPAHCRIPLGEQNRFFNTNNICKFFQAFVVLQNVTPTIRVSHSSSSPSVVLHYIDRRLCTMCCLYYLTVYN